MRSRQYATYRNLAAAICFVQWTINNAQKTCVFCPIAHNSLLVGHILPAYNFSATIPLAHCLRAVTSLNFLATENIPPIAVKLRIVDYTMRGERLSWQSCRIIASRLVRDIFSVAKKFREVTAPKRLQLEAIVAEKSRAGIVGVDQQKILCYWTKYAIFAHHL